MGYGHGHLTFLETSRSLLQDAIKKFEHSIISNGALLLKGRVPCATLVKYQKSLLNYCSTSGIFATKMADQICKEGRALIWIVANSFFLTPSNANAAYLRNIFGKVGSNVLSLSFCKHPKSSIFELWPSGMVRVDKDT